MAMAQAAHGSAPDIAGLNIANPTGIISSGIMLLRWLAEKHTDHKLPEVAATVDCALYQTLQDEVKTKDLGGHASTSDFTEAILDRVNSLQK
jgi:3-isopropylmalate dehydrogenase